MKLLFFAVALPVLASCVSYSAKLSEAGKISTHTNNASPSPTVTPEPTTSRQDTADGPDEKFKIVPQNFNGIDFLNFSYPYKFSYHIKPTHAVLKDGEYIFDFLEDGGDRGWFHFKDVYYIDLTNDRNKEALVMLWHVSCGYGSCDGGAALLYVYGVQQNKPKLMWKYEVGSTGFGCGLQSLTVKNRKIILELFGRCRNDNTTDSMAGKFIVKDTTRLTFGFNGKKIVKEKKQLVAVPEREVRNYKPEISISE